MCLDAHHLLVNLRVKVCKDGLFNIRKEAWHKVAETDRNIISKSLVCDLIDKQSNAYAQRTFSTKVQAKMQELGFVNEAKLCKVVREWYEAEDMPGIAASERISRRLHMKSFILQNVDFGVFPPKGAYINGFTRASFEGFVQRIDTTIQLYALSKSSSYNIRAVSSLVNETFFGELSTMESTRLGCPKAISIPRLISTVTELLHYRCDPSERMFCMATSRQPVYPVQCLLEESTKSRNESKVDDVNNESVIQTIIPRNHFFDSMCRRRTQQRKSKASDISKPGEVSRGCQPVRQHHKCDESKILPTNRLGIDMMDFKKIK